MTAATDFFGSSGTSPPQGRVCEIEDCEKRHKARGWCDMHYHRWQTHGDPLMVLPRGRKPTCIPVVGALRRCSIVDCENPHLTRGYCNPHYQLLRRQKQRGRVCSVPGCGGRHVARGWCQHHYDCWRWRNRAAS